MRFTLDTSEIFVPDGLAADAALARTAHLAIAAHQDDIEIMAAGPILDCFGQPDLWFSGAVVTDGRNSPRSGSYAAYDDETMRLVRFEEQRKAAVVGEYGALVMLDFPSSAVKNADDPGPVEDLKTLLEASRPRCVYLHNLADKHDTHVAVGLRSLAALRLLPPELRPEKVYGCEVWRGLDWMDDSDKVAMDVSRNEHLQAALLGVFDSQIAGGKRYDLASMGRRRANATYFESHGVDLASAVSFAMDLTPLVDNPSLEIGPFVQEYISRFAQDVNERLIRFQTSGRTTTGPSMETQEKIRS